ncbi:MAG: sugar transferase [Planctomycetota bacterium]|nr:sugar transferase [Planctomycetota bacterium]
MTGRTIQTILFGIETIVLLLVVLPVAHARSLLESLLLPGGDVGFLNPNEGFFVFGRSFLVVASIQIVFAMRDLYRWTVIVRPQLVVTRLIESGLVIIIVIPLFHLLMGMADRTFLMSGALARLQVHPLLLIACGGAAFLTGYGLRIWWPKWLKSSHLAERIAIMGNGPEASLLTEEVRRNPKGSFEFVGRICEIDHGPITLGPPDRLIEIARERQLQRLVVGPDIDLSPTVLLALKEQDIEITDADEYYELITGKIPLSIAGDTHAPENRVPRGAIFPRLLDLLIATLGLILVFPVMLLAAVAIKLDSRGPVFYRQQRVGKDGSTFTVTKFRSMRQDAEERSGPVWASVDDHRITRVGRWLRKMRIDEFPQLWNVITNKMSLVGPRPERPVFVDNLTHAIPVYHQRHSVKPGVTGWAQINHSYGNSLDDAFIKLQLDLWYIKHKSIALDISILLRTVKVIVLQQGAV